MTFNYRLRNEAVCSLEITVLQHKLQEIFFQIFCPKDDTKHRALWRQLYTDCELQYLKRLIDKCRENNVTFVYGISPGLDISYSKAKEIGLLKAKLDQLKSAGCGGFCLLWDDIETTLPQVKRFLDPAMFSFGLLFLHYKSCLCYNMLDC